MVQKIKKIFRFDLWIDPIFDRMIGEHHDLSLHIAPLAGSSADNWEALQAAHIYQVSPARNELPLPFHAGTDLLDRCPGLLCVSSAGAGHDTVDVAACTARGVAVVNQIGGNSVSVGEQAIGLMLAVSRRLVEADRKLRSVRNFSRESVMGHEISGKTLGLVGLGHAGTATAKLARAFGMTLLAFDPLLSANEIRARGAEPVTLGELLARADIVSLHCPKDATTANMIDATAFAAMKTGALFISTARGGIHDEQALFDALKSGKLAGAGLDVWAVEPPPLDHPLLTLDNIVATFHTAGVSHEGRRNVARMGAEQIIALHPDHPPARLVNPEVWPQFCQRYDATFGPSASTLHQAVVPSNTDSTATGARPRSRSPEASTRTT